LSAVTPSVKSASINACELLTTVQFGLFGPAGAFEEFVGYVELVVALDPQFMSGAAVSAGQVPAQPSGNAPGGVDAVGGTMLEVFRMQHACAPNGAAGWTKYSPKSHFTESTAVPVYP